MTETNELTVKRENADTERTYAGKTFTPATDIFETPKALMLVMDMPGVARNEVEIKLDNDKLEVEGRIGYHERLKDRDVLYSEYNIGNYYRRFTLSNKIDRAGIEAKLDGGVLTLILPKVADATPRRIAIQ